MWLNRDAQSKLSISEIRTAISALTDATEARFGSTKRNLALVGLFWLRFVCPAIVDPFHTGVLKRSSRALNCSFDPLLTTRFSDARA